MLLVGGENIFGKYKKLKIKFGIRYWDLFIIGDWLLFLIGMVMVWCVEAWLGQIGIIEILGRVSGHPQSASSSSITEAQVLEPRKYRELMNEAINLELPNVKESACYPTPRAHIILISRLSIWTAIHNQINKIFLLENNNFFHRNEIERQSICHYNFHWIRLGSPAPRCRSLELGI